MGTVTLPIRHLRMQNRGIAGLGESNIDYMRTSWEIDPGESALILVDFWSTHVIDSHLKRCGEIIASSVVPLLPAARSAGFSIVHAPGQGTAPKYADHPGYLGETRKSAPTGEPSLDSGWPPKDLRNRSGDYSQFDLKFLSSEASKHGHELASRRRIPDDVAPEPEDHIVVTGEELHEFLSDMRIVHLLYLGFATNDCLLYKDYGIRAMGSRGYNIALLRDCTTGIEDSASLASLSSTRAAIQFIEFHHASATSVDLIAACRRASDENM